VRQRGSRVTRKKKEKVITPSGILRHHLGFGTNSRTAKPKTFCSLANSRRCTSGFAISRWQSNRRINAVPTRAPPVTGTANRCLASFPGVKTRDRTASCSPVSSDREDPAVSRHRHVSRICIKVQRILHALGTRRE